MALFDVIDAAKSVDGLLLNVLRNHIPLHSIKSLIKSELSCKSEKSMRKILYTETDLTDVIPNDICQHILTFVAQQQSIKSVSKPFNTMVNQNRANWIRTWRATRTPQMPPISEERKTFYVDPEQKPLTQRQIDRGIQGPIQSIVKAMDIMKSGDKLILCEGMHRYDGNPKFLRKDMEIEGIGKCCIAFSCRSYTIIQSKLSLNNIIVATDEELSVQPAYIFVEKGGALRFNDCHIICCSWTICSDALMECDRCLFSLKLDPYDFGISQHSKSSAVFIDCRFEVEPSEGIPMFRSFHHDNDKVSFKLIGCEFRKNGRPYLSKTDKEFWDAKNKEISCIRYNRLVPSDTSWRQHALRFGLTRLIGAFNAAD